MASVQTLRPAFNWMACGAATFRGYRATKPLPTRTITVVNTFRGCNFQILFEQDATGGHTLTLPANSVFAAGYALGSAPNAITKVSGWYDGVNYHWKKRITPFSIYPLSQNPLTMRKPFAYLQAILFAAFLLTPALMCKDKQGVKKHRVSVAVFGATPNDDLRDKAAIETAISYSANTGCEIVFPGWGIPL